jgi:hypothetical protein
MALPFRTPPEIVTFFLGGGVGFGGGGGASSSDLTTGPVPVPVPPPPLTTPPPMGPLTAVLGAASTSRLPSTTGTLRAISLVSALATSRFFDMSGGMIIEISWRMETCGSFVLASGFCSSFCSGLASGSGAAGTGATSVVNSRLVSGRFALYRNTPITNEATITMR